jgi:hypothetical protein
MVSAHRVSIHAPAGLALQIVTELADADGVDLTSSESPTASSGDHMVDLDVVIDGSRAAVTSAVDGIRAGLPKGSSISIEND